MAYNLLNRIPDGLKPILEIYQNYVSKLGKDIVTQLGSSVTKNPKSYVDQLLSLHQKYYQVNHQVFSSDPLFTAAVDKAFRTIINDSSGNNLPANGPETLARYCDMMMKKNAGKKEATSAAGGPTKRKGLKKPIVADMDEGDQEERLMKMVTLFKYVEDKDVFQKFYSRMLAKRLIYGASSSEELEINMINRLKEICGVEYTSKLNKMFTDMSLSSDLNTKFKNYVKEKNLTGQGIKIKKKLHLNESTKKTLSVNMDILVLTAGAWPLNQKEDTGPDTNKIQIPAVVSFFLNIYDMFFNELINWYAYIARK